MFSQFTDNLYNRLVEVGCGFADTIYIAKKYNLEYLGLDISKEYIDMCKNSFDGHPEFNNIDIFTHLSTYEKEITIFPFFHLIC